MTLAVALDDREPGHHAPLNTVWLHGFTQTGRSWRPLFEAPAWHSVDQRRVCVDLPGHGASPLAAGDLWWAADQVISTVNDLGVRHGVLVGYSLGGRTALHAALTEPRRWRGVVLIGATAGLADAAARADRRRGDEMLAERIEHIGVDEFLTEWLAQPLFAGLPHRPDDLDERRRNTAAGLAGSLRHHGTGTQQDLRPKLGELTMPALVLAGGRDTKFVAAARDIAQVWGGEAHFVDVPDAGHAAHLERPEMTARLIAEWLETLPAIS